MKEMILHSLRFKREKILSDFAVRIAEARTAAAKCSLRAASPNASSAKCASMCAVHVTESEEALLKRNVRLTSPVAGCSLVGSFVMTY